MPAEITGTGSSVRRRVARSPLAPVAAAVIRLRAVLRHMRGELAKSVRWLISSRETTNYNYSLTSLNRTHLMWWVAEVAGIPVAQAGKFFNEIENDEEFAAHIRAATETSGYRRVSDPDSALGRRVAWYALVRALKPDLVVETGIEKGFGTCVLAAAVRRNGRGRVVGVDTSATSGWLIGGPYADVTEVVIQDAAAALAAMPGHVDMLFHDVHFTAKQEMEEYEAALGVLSPSGVIVNDNGHGYAALPDLAAERSWRFLHFHERPERHWYPGAGMSAAWDPEPDRPGD